MGRNQTWNNLLRHNHLYLLFIFMKQKLRNLIRESIASEIYFDTFTGAVGTARAAAEAKGYTIDQDDWFREINTGHGRPSEGQTTRATVGLIASGKPQRKALHIQVYNRGNDVQNRFELNYYIA